MDPLSIATSVISFIEIAKTIKDSIGKIGQNREAIRELMEDVLEELAELHKLCHDWEGRLGHLDYDSVRSLAKLQSELNNVLERCLKLPERRKSNNALSSAKYYVIAWLKRAEIEAQILRLRDRVSSVHRRFNYISSLRVEQTENRLLVASSEQGVMLGRLEGLVSQLLINSHMSGTYPSSILDYANPNGVEYQFLQYQVQKTVCLLERISASYTFPREELRGAESLGYKLADGWIPARVSLLRSTTIEVLQTLQLLENQPYNLSLWEGAQHLMQLGIDLNDLELKDDAAAVVIWSTAIYQTLMERNPITYLPYVAWGLAQLAAIRNGTPEGLRTAKRGVDLCREVAAMSQADCSMYLAKSLCLYADHLITNGRFEDALIHSKEALAIQRKTPAPQEGLYSIPVCWEAPGEEYISLSSARSFSRPYQTAVEDGVCLSIYAKSLALVDQSSEALIIATEAIACLEALTKYDPQAQAYKVWLTIMREDRESFIMSICSPSPPLVASISAVDEESSPGAQLVRT